MMIDRILDIHDPIDGTSRAPTRGAAGAARAPLRAPAAPRFRTS
jgi:hypothetical protein